MESYVNIYLKSRGLGVNDPVFCEICGAHAADIFKIENPVRPENLIALCTYHFNEATQNRSGRGILKETVKLNLMFLKQEKGQLISLS